MLESQGPGGVMGQSAGAAVARSSIGGMLYIRLCGIPLSYTVSFRTGRKPWTVGRGRFMLPVIG